MFETVFPITAPVRDGTCPFMNPVEHPDGRFFGHQAVIFGRSAFQTCSFPDAWISGYQACQIIENLDIRILCQCVLSNICV